MKTFTYNIATFDLIQLMDNVNITLNKKLYSNIEGDITDGYCDAIGDQVIFNFYIDLISNEVILLNNTISNYSYNPNYSQLKKFKLTNTTDNPSEIDYDIYGLHKKRIIEFGELRQIDYYKNYEYSSNTYTNLVLTEYRTYVRDVIGIVQYRNMTVKWYLNDDTIGLTKVYNLKYYSQAEAIQEGIDRRNNMIGFAKTTLLNELKITVGEPTNQSYAFDFLLGVSTQMTYFREGYTQPLRDAVTGSTKSYMTQTIKNKVVTNLSFI